MGYMRPFVMGVQLGNYIFRCTIRLFGLCMGVKTKCTKEEQRQKDRYPVYIRRLAARHPRTHRETKCYFGDTFVLHLNQI